MSRQLINCKLFTFNVFKTRLWKNRVGAALLPLSWQSANPGGSVTLLVVVGRVMLPSDPSCRGVVVVSVSFCSCTCCVCGAAAWRTAAGMVAVLTAGGGAICCACCSTVMGVGDCGVVTAPPGSAGVTCCAPTGDLSSGRAPLPAAAGGSSRLCACASTGVGMSGVASAPRPADVMATPPPSCAMYSRFNRNASANIKRDEMCVSLAEREYDSALE